MRIVNCQPHSAFLFFLNFTSLTKHARGAGRRTLISLLANCFSLALVSSRTHPHDSDSDNSDLHNNITSDAIMAQQRGPVWTVLGGVAAATTFYFLGRKTTPATITNPSAGIVAPEHLDNDSNPI